MDQVRREAVLEAEMLLEDVDIDAGTRVPVFDLIEDRGIWLTFEPLKKLFGMYQRVGDVAGIAIHAGHPTALQRFTAAHELGHHILGHAGSLDDGDTIEGAPQDPREVAAQTFAASLLMPLVSVEQHLGRLGLDPERPQLRPQDAYRLSVEFGVSFRAVLIQLNALGKLGRAAMNQWSRLSPLDIKIELGEGHRPGNARAAVWRLGLDDNGRRITADIGDEFVAVLPETRSSGFEWGVPEATRRAFALVRDEFLPSRQPSDATERIYGGRGGRLVVMKAVESGFWPLELGLSQPWAGGEEAARFAMTVTVAAPRTSDVGRGFSINQQPQLLLAA
jgi:Zn-dependent peptidase ImmA (M78 family)